MRRGVAAAVTVVAVWLWGGVEAAWAQQGLTVGTRVLFYGDNTEFRNPFREGETLLGAAGTMDGRIELGPSAALTLGVFGNLRFGGGSAFERVRPVVSLTVGGSRSRFVFGTLESPHAGVPPGPDRTGPHGLLPPLQRETLAFERPYEAGLQWLFDGGRLQHDAWLNWQRLNTPEHRERLDGGLLASWLLSGPVSLPLQIHIVHEGGQQFASGPVRDSLAVAGGIRLSHGPGGSDGRTRPPDAAGALQTRMHQAVVSLELLGLWSRHTQDRERPEATRDGAAFFGRAAVERTGWRAHLTMWRGADFVKDEGDPNYLSVRMDGSRYLGVRDYAEAGITRSFRVSPGAALEASFRLHRVERHYEYSYRILAVAVARTRLK